MNKLNQWIRPGSLVVKHTIRTADSVKYMMAYQTKSSCIQNQPQLIECSYVRKHPLYINAYLSSFGINKPPIYNHPVMTIRDYTRQLHEILRNAPQETRDQICIHVYLMIGNHTLTNHYLTHSYSELHQSLNTTACNYDFSGIKLKFQSIKGCI